MSLLRCYIMFPTKCDITCWKTTTELPPHMSFQQDAYSLRDTINSFHLIFEYLTGFSCGQFTLSDVSHMLKMCWFCQPFSFKCCCNVFLACIDICLSLLRNEDCERLSYISFLVHSSILSLTATLTHLDSSSFVCQHRIFLQACNDKQLKCLLVVVYLFLKNKKPQKQNNAIY